MIKAKQIRQVFLATTLLWSSVSPAISKEMHALVRMETHSNAVASRSSEFVRMEHYEIPLELVEKSIAERANKEFVKSMIFERDGQQFVRWLINPEDTKWHLEVEKFMKENNIPVVRKSHFVGYMTASRSYIAVDPKSGAEFSIKMSTDRTGGAWRDKQQTWDDANQIRMMTDFVNDMLKNQPKLQHIVLLDEPMAFGLKGIDQAMVIRSYEEIKTTGKRYVPGFSIMHDKFGKEIAAANGSKDPADFWNEHYNKPLARALAEFTALTGMTYDSPHSQNFLVELDAKNRPTGKIVLRDFGDTYLVSEFFEAANRQDILKAWEQSNVKRGVLPMAVGILHGNTAPSWMVMDGMSKNSYNSWAIDFFAEYENEFKKQTGTDLKIGNRETKAQRGGNYVQKYYSMKDAEAAKFFELTKTAAQRDAGAAKTCSYLFLAK